MNAAKGATDISGSPAWQSRNVSAVTLGIWAFGPEASPRVQDTTPVSPALYRGLAWAVPISVLLWGAIWVVVWRLM